MTLAAYIPVSLPGGYVDPSGSVIRDATIRPLTGLDQEWAAGIDAATPEAVFTTDLLARTVTRLGTVPVAREHTAGLTPGDRDFLLLKIAEISLDGRVHLVLNCEKCAGKMDTEFFIGEIPVERRDLASSWSLEGQDGVRFRLPLGRDLEEAADVEDEDVLTSVLAGCIIEPVSPQARLSVARDPKSRAALIEAMERLLPRAETEIEATCPECRWMGRHLFEPVSWFLRTVGARQRQFEREFHLLSLYYHWNPDSILRMPLRERARYCEILIRELDNTSALLQGFGT